MTQVADPRISLLALLRLKGVNWSFIAREAQVPEGLEHLLEGRANEVSEEAVESIATIKEALPSLDHERDVVGEMIERAEAEGVRLTTVLDADYPTNLRTIFNLPPFLFVRGALREDDTRSVAVVGTRKPSTMGLSQARSIATLLAENDVTVLSGLARGIDTAAHEACLAAERRTIAVLGSGIRRVYPPENISLAEKIAERGAVVSQFWPDAPPSRYSFPRRNVVTSGMGQGTVVIEASATSGAKMQARLALQHGKRVWLLRSLIEDYDWARKYLSRGAVAVDEVDDIIRLLRSTEAVKERVTARMQLRLAV